MLIEKDYCDYDTCVALKDFGLNISDRCVPDYLEGKRIHIWDAQKWLREEKEMLLQPTYLELSDEWICIIRDKKKRRGYSSQQKKSYEEALLEGIKEAIKLLKEEK